MLVHGALASEADACLYNAAAGLCAEVAYNGMCMCGDSAYLLWGAHVSMMLYQCTFRWHIPLARLSRNGPVLADVDQCSSLLEAACCLFLMKHARLSFRAHSSYSGCRTATDGQTIFLGAILGYFCTDGGYHGSAAG
jgi:hypothetical protein